MPIVGGRSLRMQRKKTTKKGFGVSWSVGAKEKTGEVKMYNFEEALLVG